MPESAKGRAKAKAALTPDEKAGIAPPGKRYHPSKADHLKEYWWKPGVSGNPERKGLDVSGPRGPNKLSLVRTLRHMLNCTPSGIPSIERIAKRLKLDPKECTIGDVVVLNLIDRSLGDKAAFVQELLNRIEGKVTDVLVHAGTELSTLSNDDLLTIVKRGLGGLSPKGE